MNARILAALYFTGCGRIDFDSVALDATPPVPDAQLVIVIDPGPHHLGNDVIMGGMPENAEGTVMAAMFEVPIGCTSAAIELTFFAPFGPNVMVPPVLDVNGTPLASVIPFFTNCSSDCDDFSGGDVHVSLDATGAILLGTNTFTVTCGSATDDFFYRDVTLRCVP